MALIEDELTSSGFPFDDVTPLKKKDMTDLKNYMILLDQIDLPEHLTGENDPPLPIKILLSPITKRFHYHFYSTSSKESFLRYILHFGRARPVLGALWTCPTHCWAI